MNASGIHVFDKSLQETHTWLNEISEVMKDPRHKIAYHALRGVLFSVRDRLPPAETFDLAAQLPVMIRGVFFEGYTLNGKPEKFGPDDFLKRVSDELNLVGGADPMKATRAVFEVLSLHVSDGEMEDVRNAMPKEFNIFYKMPTVSNN